VYCSSCNNYGYVFNHCLFNFQIVVIIVSTSMNIWLCWIRWWYSYHRVQEVTGTLVHAGYQKLILACVFQYANTCMQTNIIPVETGSTDAGKQTTPPVCIWLGQMQSGCLKLAWLGWEGYQTRPKVAPDANCGAICGLPVPICVVGRGCCNESFWRSWRGGHSVAQLGLPVVPFLVSGRI
jgi:hypothetical protein